MNEFMFWLFACIGATNIIVESELSRKVKDFIEPYTPVFFIKMLNCYQCSGFWAGVFITTGYLYICNMLIEKWFYIFMGGCASSFASTFFAYLQTYIEANSIVQEKS